MLIAVNYVVAAAVVAGVAFLGQDISPTITAPNKPLIKEFIIPSNLHNMFKAIAMPTIISFVINCLSFETSPSYILELSYIGVITKIITTKNNKSKYDKIIPFFTKGYEGFDLNQPYDWEYATYLIKQKMVQLPVIQTAIS